MEDNGMKIPPRKRKTSASSLKAIAKRIGVPFRTIRANQGQRT